MPAPADNDKVPQSQIDAACAIHARDLWERLNLPDLPPDDKAVSSPFREDKNPSFHVGGAKPEFFHDFATSESWNGIQFTRAILKCGFKEAIEFNINGTIPSGAPREEPARSKPKQPPPQKPIPSAKTQTYDRLPCARDDPKAATMLLVDYGLAPEMIPETWKIGESASLKEPAIFYPGETVDGEIVAIKVKSLERDDKDKRRIRHEEGKGGAVALVGRGNIPGIVIVGGEEKAAAARAAGYYGVSPLAGEGHLPDDWVTFFVAMQKPIILANDNDPAGAKANDHLQKLLLEAGLPPFLIRKVWWPDTAAPKADLNDVLKREGPDGVRSLIESATSERTMWQGQEYTFFDGVQERPPIPYCLDGIIAKPSLNVFYGPPGDHKTNVMLDISVCVAAGLPWRPPLNSANSEVEEIKTTKTRVLWIDCDMGKRRSLDRVGAFVRGNKAPLGSPWQGVSMPSPWPDIKNHFAELSKRIRDHGVGLVIVDNLKVVCRGIEENSSEMADVMAAWRLLTEMTGAAVVFIHHQRKGNSNKSRAGDSLRGHSSIEGALDLVVNVQRAAERSDIVVIESTKARSIAVEPLAVRVCADLQPNSREWRSVKCWGDNLPENWIPGGQTAHGRQQLTKEEKFAPIVEILENAGAIGLPNAMSDTDLLDLLEIRIERSRKTCQLRLAEASESGAVWRGPKICFLPLGHRRADETPPAF